MKSYGDKVDKVLIIWTVFNHSNMEKCHLMTKGLEKAGVKTYSIGLSDPLEQRKYLEKVFLQDAEYAYEYGSKRKLYQGKSYFSKILNNIYMSSRYSLRLLSYVIREKVSFIIIPTQPIEVTLPTLIIGKIFRIKIVTNIMEYLPAMPSYSNRKNFLIRWSWKLIINYSDAFIVISHFLYDKIQNSTGKQLMILPAILPEDQNLASANHERLENSLPLFIYTSSSGYEDLLEFTLESLSKLKHRKFKFIITGKYPDDEILMWNNRIKSLELSGKVVFSGFLSENELNDLQIQSNALLIPLLDNDRHKARFPQKVPGYMQLGNPVVTTEVGEIAYYFKDGESVVMDDSVTVEGFSEKISFVMDEPGLTNEIGRHGKVRVESKFNMESLGIELNGFLRSIK